MVNLVKADLRQPITGFGLLDWAYRKECVRAAGEEEWAQLEGHGQSILARAGNVGIKGMSHGAINGRLDVHIDALRVDRFVYENCSSQLYNLVTVHAEKGKPVPHLVNVRRVTACIPRYHENNSQRLVKMYDHNRNWIGCEVEYDGLSEVEVQELVDKHLYFHGQFIALLDALPELVLDKWRVDGRGT